MRQVHQPAGPLDSEFNFIMHRPKVQRGQVPRSWQNSLADMQKEEQQGIQKERQVRLNRERRR